MMRVTEVDRINHVLDFVPILIVSASDAILGKMLHGTIDRFLVVEIADQQCMRLTCPRKNVDLLYEKHERQRFEVQVVCYPSDI